MCSGANDEVILDIEIIASIVPAASVRVYFAPNSWDGFYNAIALALADSCNVVSISWGAPEKYWGSSELARFNTLMAAYPNAVVTAAAGDSGSSDGASGVNADFPSSSPVVLACGGTTLVSNVGKTAIVSETVWNNNSTSSATGGGVSAYFSKPAYQFGITALTTKRGVPDVAGVADPHTGFSVYGEGSGFVVGGTSCIAPLWAALIARLNQSLGRSLGFTELHNAIYRNPSISRDVVSGNNGAYSASTKWDACTGNGSPNGSLLLALLNGTRDADPAPTSPPLPPSRSFRWRRHSASLP